MSERCPEAIRCGLLKHLQENFGRLPRSENGPECGRISYLDCGRLSDPENSTKGVEAYGPVFYPESVIDRKMRD